MKKYRFFVAVMALTTFLPWIASGRHKKGASVLARTIDSLMLEDQKYRWMLQLGTTDAHELDSLKKLPAVQKIARMQAVVSGKAGFGKQVADSLWVLQNKLDERNFAIVSAIIRDNGYPVNYASSYNVGIILQHSSARIDDEFLQLLRNQVREGNMPASEYAIVYDNRQLALKKPKLYYTDGSLPADIAATNKARKELGLKPLSE